MNTTKDTTEKRGLKILGLILCAVISYVMLYYTNNELYIQRYEGIFVGFIEIYLNNYMSLDYFSLTPLFSSGIQIDPSLSTTAQHIMETESYFPNFVVIFLILHYITGLSPQLLLILPLGVIFIPIAYLAVIKAYVPIKNSSDYIFQFLLAVYFIIYLVGTRFYGSFYVAPVTFLLILIILLCIKKFYEKEHKRSLYFLIICVSILSLAHYWHSMLMMVVFFIMALWIVSGFFYLVQMKFTNINQKKESIKIIFARSTSLFVISIVLALSFIHLWQSQYIGEFLGNASIFDFLSKALTKLFGGNPYPVPYSFNYKDLFWGKIYYISLLLIYILSSLILIVPIFLNILQIMRKETIRITLPLVFGLSIILAVIINTIAYYKTNSLAFPQVALFFPIFGVYLFIDTNNKKEKLKKYIIFSLSLLIVLSVICNVSLYLTNEAGTASVTKYENSKSSFDWLYQNMDKNKIVIADFNLIGKYLQREAKISKPIIEYEYISPNSYSILVCDNENVPKYLTKNYVGIDYATMSKGLPIHSNSARALLKPEWDQINNCQNQNKIYQDNYVSIFIFK